MALIFTSAIEFALCFQVYRYGRQELMPKLTQRQFGAAIVGALLGISAMWLTVKGIIDDPLFLIAFAVTAWMPPVFSTVLLCGRGSMRGQTMLMNWSCCSPDRDVRCLGVLGPLLPDTAVHSDGRGDDWVGSFQPVGDEQIPRSTTPARRCREEVSPTGAAT